jgi:hypothetical protein
MNTKATFTKPEAQLEHRWWLFTGLRAGQPHKRVKHCNHKPSVGSEAPRFGAHLLPSCKIGRDFHLVLLKSSFGEEYRLIAERCVLQETLDLPYCHPLGIMAIIF